MNLLPTFESFLEEGFIATGFSMSGSQPNTTAYSYPRTGYDLKPVAYKIEQLSKAMAEQAMLYENDDDPGHTAVEYLKEAKQIVCDSIDKAYRKS